MNDQTNPEAGLHPWLMVGLGSPHGSDRLGWDLVQLLQETRPEAWTIRMARVPTDVLDWLEGCQRLHLVDACPMFEQLGRVHRLLWPDAQILRNRTTTSHDYDVPQVLQLAQSLGQLPPEVVIWAIEVEASTRLDPTPDWMLAAARMITATEFCDKAV